MTRVLAIVNQKGGVGKTTTTVNLAASLASAKRRVLLIDMDAQGNATTGVGVDKHSVEKSCYEVLLNQATVDESLIHLEKLNFDLLAANGDLTAAEVELLNSFGREFKLKKALESVQSRYHYILIDCPPSLSMLTVNSLVAATGLIIPMQCEYFALEGLSALLRTIDEIKASVNADLKVEGVLRTMYDPRNNLANDVADQLREHFGKVLYETVIPRNVRLAEAPSHGIPALQYARDSRGALAYLALAGEILRREYTVDDSDKKIVSAAET